MSVTMSRPGFVNGASDGSWEQDNALFRDQLQAEVLTAFEEKNIFKALHMVRNITQGKSASFPRVWKANGRYHTPGSAVLGSNNIPHNEVVIKVDDLLLADVFVYDLDALKNEYEVRSTYANLLGDALADTYDEKVARIMLLGARMAGKVDGAPGGSVLKNTSAPTDGDILAGMMFDAAQTMDEKDIPENERYFATRPAQWYLLAQTTKVLNRDWGGKGSYSDGTVVNVAGVNILKSNHIPSTNITTAVAGENNDYTGDFTTSVGVVFQKQAAASVHLMDVTTQMTSPDGDFNAMYQGHLMLGKMAVGHGITRPECCVEISSASS